MIDIRDHGGSFSGRNGGKLNIYSQLTEPVKKQGIWLQTSHNYKKVVNETEMYYANAWIDPSLNLFAEAPYNLAHHTAVTVGKKIYIMGTSFDSTTSLYNYSYDTVTNTWTKLVNLWVGMSNHTAVAIGTKIYVMGGLSNAGLSPLSDHYVYDTLTNTWTKMASLPVTNYNHTAVAIGTKIYVMGGYTSTTGSGSYYSRFYVYDTINNTWTTMPAPPSGLSSHTAVVIGNKIYTMGSAAVNAKENYSYDVDSQIWTKLTDVPYSVCEHTAVAIGTKIYVMGGLYSTSTLKNFYVFDTMNNTWTKLTDLTLAVAAHTSVNIGSKIYMMGGGDVPSYSKTHKVYSFTAKVFEEDTLVIFRNHDLLGTYYTELLTPSKGIQGLFSTLLSGFNNAWMYYDSDIQELPAYYGDGTKWIKFKN